MIIVSYLTIGSVTSLDVLPEHILAHVPHERTVYFLLVLSLQELIFFCIENKIFKYFNPFREAI